MDGMLRTKKQEKLETAQGHKTWRRRHFAIGVKGLHHLLVASRVVFVGKFVWSKTKQKLKEHLFILFYLPALVCFLLWISISLFHHGKGSDSDQRVGLSIIPTNTKWDRVKVCKQIHVGSNYFHYLSYNK